MIHARSCLVHSLVSKKKYLRPLDNLTLFYNTVKNNENFRKMTIFKWLPKIQFSTDLLLLGLIFFVDECPSSKGRKQIYLRAEIGNILRQSWQILKNRQL